MIQTLFTTFFIALMYALLSAAPVAAQSHDTHQHSFKARAMGAGVRDRSVTHDKSPMK
jgi:hypothetical protein